ncbi:hypothetical protein FXO37_10090 [Capsicum annuum]|nr:hypothetical protein FXO37_10090 [Capsicum annuum]
MDLRGCVNGLGMELLNQSNYKVWKTRMKSYLVGENLRNVGSNTSSPDDGPGSSNAYQKWKQINAKAEFILKRTLDQLFNKRNEARLQILENELKNTTQGNLSGLRTYVLRFVGYLDQNYNRGRGIPQTGDSKKLKNVNLLGGVQPIAMSSGSTAKSTPGGSPKMSSSSESWVDMVENEENDG